MKRRGGGWLWITAGACCAVAAAAYALGTLVRSPWEEAVENSQIEPVVTAEVEQRSIAAAIVSLEGKVAAGTESDVTIVSGEGGEAVVTATHKAPGELLTPGSSLAEVSGRPVIALTLPFPLYRDLKPGDSGADVRAVQQALAAMGLYSGPIDAEFGHATSAGVQALYEQAGTSPSAPTAEEVTAVETADDAHVVASEQLSQARSARDQAAQALTAAQQQLQAARTSGTGVAEATSNAQAAEAALEVSASGVDQAGRAQTRAREALADAELKADTELPRNEVVVIPAEGATVVSISPTGTKLAGESASVAKLRTGQASVTARVGVKDAGQFALGAAVSVRPTTNVEASQAGAVAAVGEFDATAEGALPGFDLTITLDGGLGELTDGQDVVVTASVPGAAVEGLAVPLVAIRDSDEGSYVTLEGEPPTREVVTIVASADGYAVVEAEGLVEGDSVIISGTP